MAVSTVGVATPINQKPRGSKTTNSGNVTLTNISTYYSVLSITGAGEINHLTVSFNVASLAIQLYLLVDGVQYGNILSFTSNATANGANFIQDHLLRSTPLSATPPTQLLNIKFKQSLQLMVECTNGSGVIASAIMYGNQE